MKIKGKGVAITIHSSGLTGGNDPSEAILRMHADGSLTVNIGSVEIGQGVKTVVRQIAAEVLQLNSDLVRVVAGDSDAGPICTGQFASRTTLVCGNAVKKAAEAYCLPILKEGGTVIFTTPCPGYASWPGFALMDLVKDFMPPTADNNEKALKAFYSHSRELWAGCIWYKIYNAMLHAGYSIVTRTENLAMASDFGFTVYDDIRQAYKDALGKHGADARVAFVPYARYSVLQV
jgi:hypothetical protein